MDFCSYFIKTKKNQEIVNSEISSKTPLLQTSKKLTKSPLLQTSKNREIAEKKIVRNFLDKINFLFFFEFFAENVLKTLLRGRETTRKKYRILFEKFEKYVIFFDFGCPSPIHPSIQAGSRLGPQRARILRQRTESITTSLEKSNKSHITTALGSRFSAFGFRLSAFGFRLSDKSENFTLDELLKSAGKKVALKKSGGKKK